MLMLEMGTHQAVNGGDQVSVEWMPYGVATDVGAWRRDMEARGPTRPQLVVLLVRVCDLEAAHPELLAGPQGAADAAAEEFVAQLREYDARAETRTTMSTKGAPVGLPHVVVLLCPSRPPLESDQDGSTSWRKMECAIETALSTMRHIDCESSSSLLDWFSTSSQGACSWYDALLDKRQHSPFTTAMCRVVAHTSARHIGRLLRSGGGFPVKKVIVLDCDNTLWGGSVADVGPLGVSITPRYLSLQRFVVRQQRERGMLLCLASKNIAQDVEAVFSQRKAEMVLQLDEHIVAKKIHWQRKSENLVDMAKELGLGLDSFIFIDDNAVECNEVATALPMVSVIHFNPCESSDSSTFLEREWVFDTALKREAAPTAEDAMRTQMYQQNQQRAALQSTSSSQTAFLSSLGIRIHFESLTADHETANPQTWGRVLQLHQRTNTFNIATSFSRSVTRDRLVLYTTRPKFTLCAHVTDRFGHYGLVCVALCRIASSSTESTSPSSSSVVVDSLLLSCRALNRGVEHAMVKRIAQVAREHQADDISISWQPTVRNEPARCFFAAWSASKFAPDEAPQSIISEREEKLTRSATVSGRWVVKTSDALDLSFLREVERANQDAHSQKPKLQSWFARSLLWLPRYLASRLVGISSRWSWTTWWCSVWMRACLRLNGLLVSCGLSRLDSSHQIQQKSPFQIGLLAFRMHSLQDISRFFDDISPKQSQTLDSQLQTEATSDESSTDEAFRMLAREQTKRALLEHISDDNVRVVWSPNRDLDDTADAPEGSQPTCATPSCGTTILNTRQRCAFGRCRTCCYRIQRLLHRACSADTHATAKAKALSSLSDDFDVSVNDIASTWSEGDESCRIHVNPRRRKGK
ncbi:hypothetical protein PINS_up006119 [Pythium insidiosum]|nr:hypothetical protein PINS_up006119 [Pythium insidiosum]